MHPQFRLDKHNALSPGIIPSPKIRHWVNFTIWPTNHVLHQFALLNLPDAAFRTSRHMIPALGLKPGIAIRHTTTYEATLHAAISAATSNDSMSLVDVPSGRVRDAML